MTAKVRVRLDEHIIIEFVNKGVILHDNTGTSNNQEDVPTYLYDKEVYMDKGVLLEAIGNMWDSNKSAGCW